MSVTPETLKYVGENCTVCSSSQVSCYCFHFEIYEFKCVLILRHSFCTGKSQHGFVTILLSNPEIFDLVLSSALWIWDILSDLKE